MRNKNLRYWNVSMIKEIEIKRKLLKKYAIKIATTNDFYVGYYATLPQKKIENFLKKFKNKLYIPSMDKLKQSIIGFYDTSVLGNGGTGYLFMEDKIYYIVFKNPKKIWYSDIKNMHIKHSHTAKKDNESEIFIKYTDDTSIFLDDFALNKTPMLSFLGDIVALGNKDKDFFKDTNCNILIMKILINPLMKKSFMLIKDMVLQQKELMI